MAACRHFILPNSSFGWWAAVLSDKTEKIVIVPAPWFDNPSNNTADLLPASWIQLPKDHPAAVAVSIVIPCHNYAKYLPESIGSVWNQTFRNFEILLVDVGSTDDSAAVAQRLAGQTPPEIPFRIFHLDNVGPGAARSFGAAQARGKYLLPLDADDRIAPDYLAKTVPLLDADQKLGLVYVDTVCFGDQQLRHNQPEYNFARLCQANFISICSLIRKAAFDDVEGFDSENWGYYEDWDLWIRLGAKGWFGKHLSEPLFFYRHHFESSLTYFLNRLDPIIIAFLRSRHPELYSPAVVAAARKAIAEMPPGWNLRPPMRDVDQIKALLADHPNNRHVLYFLGCALVKDGARQEAENVLRRLLALHPDDTQAQEVLKQLTVPLTAAQTGQSPLVSVIVPTFNRPSWLGETVRSILAQTYRNFEIIVVNDAGPDVSHVVEPLNSEGCIRLINHEQNKGLAAARNTGIRAARGDYIAYLDDDDIFHANHLQTLVEHLETTGGDVAYTDAHRAHQRKQGDIYEIFERDVPYSFDFDYNRILWENFVPVLCFIHRKSCWEAVGGFDESLRVLEDWDLWIRMSRLYKFDHIPTVTCEFRWRTDSSSMTAADHAKFETTTQTILAKHRTERPEPDEPCPAGDFVPSQTDFGETNYLATNPDVAEAVRDGRFLSGWHHFVKSGRREGRRWFRKSLARAKQDKGDKQVEALKPAGCDYDILIPIFNAPDDVQRCVESLLRNTEPRHTIYLLDDASPDKRIAPLLAGLAARHSHMKVVTAGKNGGFVVNVNRGFAISRRDVVILNSDTEVTAGWLDRMDRCRCSQPAIGIVCPLSNNATILSVPRMNARNVLPAGMTPDAFAKLVAQHSERLYPQIPTAIGFCMLITRETLDAVGVFDPVFGLGYGEENDLCLRAWDAGKHTVCCDDAYVQHYGEASFGQVAGIGERRRRNAELLERRWPQYSTSVYRYCQRNPLRKLQERLRLALAVSTDRRPHVLQVIHNYNAPGGTELHTQEIVERISNRFRQTVTFPGNIGEWSDFSEVTSPAGIRIAVMNRLNAAPTHLYLGSQPGDVRNAAVEANFRQFVAGGDYDLIHFQHLAGWASLQLPRIAKELGKRCVISLHDYFLQCPEYVLLNEAGERCNKVRADAEDKDCLRCLAAKRYPLARELPAIPQYLRLRQGLSREVLEQMEAIVAPSEFVQRRILEAFGGDLADRVRVIPHGVNMSPRRHHGKVGTPLRVGVLGTLNYQKGLKLVAEAANLLIGAPLQLEVFGQVPPAAHDHLARLGIRERGGYRRDQLPELLRDVDLVLIPSLFDETFCLTLSEAQALGIPVLASAVGAIPERIVNGETGFLFSPATGQALAAKLRELCQSPELIRAAGERVRKLKVKTMDQNAEDYAELYRQVLSAPARPVASPSNALAASSAPGAWLNSLTQKPDATSLTSIVILTWNQLEHTQRCVESIAAHTPERHEIIFVDNGSTDGTVAWLRDYAKDHQHVRLVENKSNRGFAGGNNQGLALAGGDFILLLNNDTVVTPGWLGRMLRAASANPQIGILGPMSNCVSGPQHVPSVPYRYIETLAAFATPWAVEHADQIQPVGRLVGFCLLMRRSVTDAIGGLD
ncbi:MAG: glycosyltransferase, partial [Verrucomicrobiota bacterium]